MDDIRGDTAGQWMTYDQLAAARNIKRAAAIRLVQRHHWRRQAGNDGLARALVPHDWAKPAEPDVGGDVAGDVTPIVAPDVTPDVVAAFREALQALTARAEAAEAARETERVRAGKAEAEAAAERVAREVERSRADRAAGELASLRAVEQARRRAGRLARLRAAWRGE